MKKRWKILVLVVVAVVVVGVVASFTGTVHALPGPFCGDAFCKN